MKYRKIPVEIEAFRFGYEEYPEWFKNSGNISLDSNPLGNCNIHTLEGIMIAKHGDWIIKGIYDELYPCKHDIFEKTYVKCDEQYR